MTRTSITTPTTAPLMDIASVADRLGVTVRHVRRLVAERRIPFVKFSRLIRFDPAEIEVWLNDARRPPMASQSASVRSLRASPVRHRPATRVDG